MSKYDRFEDLEEVQEEVGEETKFNNLVAFPRPKWVDFGWWRDDAACAKVPKTVFFPPSSRRIKETQENLAKARSICAKCPVMIRCYEFAVRNNEQHGIWAGTTPKQREVVYRKLVATGILESPQVS